MSNNQKHDEHTRLGALKPDLTGLIRITFSMQEVNHFNSKGLLIGQSDNTYISEPDKRIIIDDYKCNYSNSQANHADYQTHREAEAWKLILPEYHITRRMVYDDFKILIFR